MTYLSHITIDRQVQGILPGSVKALTLQQDSLDPSGALDGTIAGLNRFLRELVEITGQNDGVHAVPVLELQFGDILTTTSLSTADGAACLSITALLPRQAQADSSLLSSAQSAVPSGVAPGCEFLWHADEGRHVVVRKIPIAELPDERSVMDAIMDTSDQAAAWFSVIGGDMSRPR